MAAMLKCKVTRADLNCEKGMKSFRHEFLTNKLPKQCIGFCEARPLTSFEYNSLSNKRQKILLDLMQKVELRSIPKKVWLDFNDEETASFITVLDYNTLLAESGLDINSEIFCSFDNYHQSETLQAHCKNVDNSHENCLANCLEIGCIKSDAVPSLRLVSLEGTVFPIVFFRLNNLTIKIARLVDWVKPFMNGRQVKTWATNEDVSDQFQESFQMAFDQEWSNSRKKHEETGSSSPKLYSSPGGHNIVNLSEDES